MKYGLTILGIRRLAQISVGEDFVSDLEAAEEEGTITLYHRTSPEAADQIMRSLRFKSLENTGEAFFSSRMEGQSEGYGDAVIAVDAPVDQVRLDDEFPSGEVHVAVGPKEQRYLRNFRRLAQQEKVLHLYDFDGTLFRSPEKPKGWPERAWWSNEKSLEEPQVPEEPTTDWWVKKVLQDAHKSEQAADVAFVLVTGRYEKFEDRINELLDQQDLDFDEVRLAPEGARSEFWKPRMLRQLINEHKPTRVEIWEDTDKVIEEFKKVCEEKDVPVKIHHINEKPHKVLEEPDVE